MGAHWSTLSAGDLAAVVRRLGVAYEPYALFLEQNGINGGTLRTLAEEGAVGPFSTKEGFNGVFSKFIDMIEVPAASWLHKVRLLREVQKSENSHPLPNQPDEAVVAEAQQRATQLADQATIIAAANAITATDTTATAPGSRTITAVQLRQMPEVLRRFQPLGHTLFVSALAASPELNDAETAFHNPEESSVAKRAAAALTINTMAKRLTDAIQTEVKFRFSQPGAARVLQAVVKAGRKGFHNIYGSVWRETISHDQIGIDEYKVAVGRAISAAQPHSDTRQNAHSVAELLQQASQCKRQFENTVNDIVSQCHDEEATAEAGDGGDFPQARVPATLKKVSRIVEKLLLHPTGPITEVGRIFDVVRGMIRCRTMSQVALVLKKLTDHPDITIVRVKDRFIASPSPGGWRDCQVCFFLNGPNNSSTSTSSNNNHICELQIVHEDLYNRRAQLPGHVVYGRVRNAEEMLEALLAGDGYWLKGGLLERARLGLTLTDLQTQLDSKIALSMLYNATNGTSWNRSSNWGTLLPLLGVWHGVTVDKAGNVLKLHLPANNMSGTALIVVFSFDHPLHVLFLLLCNCLRNIT